MTYTRLPRTAWVLHEAWGCLLTAKQGLPLFISSLKFSVVGKVPRDLLGTLLSFAWPEDMNYGDSKDYREVNGIFERGDRGLTWIVPTSATDTSRESVRSFQIRLLSILCVPKPGIYHGVFLSIAMASLA
ncbi:hypothetical protein VNO77_37409 [Canavalia gladiata]|uniref:Uncharacterized protein n=1 Tax=Canavalia gladiata TaxID=3824 RepID=A0AAN9K8U3_CANGL